MNNFTLGCSYKNRVSQLETMVKTADMYLPTDVNFLLIDGGSSYENILRLRKTISEDIGFDREVRFLDSSKNSLVQGWNYGLIHSDTRYVIYTSSDVVFHTNGIVDYFQSKIKEGYEYILAGNHAVFCLDKAAIPKMGMWCEEYRNGPHFDTHQLIKASEGNVKIDFGTNNWHNHGDTSEESRLRLKTDQKDRLPMNDFHNEKVFKSIWETDWLGWEEYVKNNPNFTNLPHPPISINQVKRNFPEICPYPYFMEYVKNTFQENL